MPTQTKEDYLRALFVLNERNSQLKSSDVASYLGVSKPTVSEMMRRLNDDGLVSSSRYAKPQFTSKGHKLAKKLTSKHRIIELFLKDMLKINESKVHEEAHRLEHAFSDESIDQLRKILRNPTTDPHGKPIPR